MSTPHLTLTESGARDDVFGFGKLKSNVTQLFPQRAQPETDRPDELLQDLRLRQELCHRLAEPLGELGYALEETEVVDPYTGTDRRLVSVLRRTIHIWYVLEVPPVVLNDASYLHRSLFGYLEFLFPPESRLRIVSPGLGVHRQPYETMARGWRDRGRWVTFINWAWLEELLDSDNVPLDRLAQTLDVPLEDQPPTSVAPAPFREDEPVVGPTPRPEPAGGSGVQGPPGGGPTDQERKLVARLLAEEAAVGGKDFFRNLLQYLSAPFGWGTPPAREGNNFDIALALVDWTNRKGTYPKRHEYWNSKALGKVIVYLYRLSGQDVRDELLAILARHQDLLSAADRAGLDDPERAG